MAEPLLEEVSACPVCRAAGPIVYNGVSDARFGVDGLFNIRECPSCSTLWLDPRPARQDIGRYYKDFYKTQDMQKLEMEWKGRPLAACRDFIRGCILAGSYGYKAGHSRLTAMLGFFLGRLPALRRKATWDMGWIFPKAPKSPGAFMLDVGCGEGDYLKIIQGLGWKVYGVEPNATAAALLRDKGIPVFEGGFEDACIPEDSVDCIMMRHVLEHVYDPAFFIRKSRSVLKKDGCLVISVPNAASLSRRVFGSSAYHLDPPRHFCMFTPKSLRMLLEAGGFRVEKMITSSFRAMTTFDHSVEILRSSKTDPWVVTPRRGRLLFAMRESLLCMSGIGAGEEIEAVFVKTG